MNISKYIGLFWSFSVAIKLAILSVLSGFLLLIGSCLIFLCDENLSYKNSFSFEKLNQLGSLTGGLVASMFSLAGIFLIYETLKKQSEQLDLQKDANNVLQVESIFFELLRMHKANVDEIKLTDNITGRESFFYMFTELRGYYYQIESTIHELKNDSNFKINGDKIDCFHIAYFLFFHGTESVEYKLHLQGLDKETNIVLRYFQKEEIKLSMEALSIDLPHLTLPYPSLQGHAKWLGHYYRHLFQTANFVIDSTNISPEQKKRYMKMLRAQLSNYEQLMLYYNALFGFPEQWKRIFIDYKLIKNIPIPLADFGISPNDFFKQEIEELKKKGEALFEYHEQK